MNNLFKLQSHLTENEYTETANTIEEALEILNDSVNFTLYGNTGMYRIRYLKSILEELFYE